MKKFFTKNKKTLRREKWAGQVFDERKNPFGFSIKFT
jgi:hypothetical protein